MSKIHVSEPSRGVTLIEIDAPPSNALSLQMRQEFDANLERIEKDENQRALIIAGRGDHFSAGDNLIDSHINSEGRLESLKQFADLIERIENTRVPVIAAIHGGSIGGGLELALACDIRIGSEQAFFIGAGVNVGLMASVYRLPRIIGVGPAKAILLSGKKVGAQEALRYGLITEIHPREQLLDEAVKLASHIATRAPLSVEATKQYCAMAFDLTPEDALKVGLSEVEKLSRSQDHREALEAFANKKTPQFSRC